MPDTGQIVIIGAGPAGLTAAYELTRSGMPAIILERDAIVGGLARTESYKGFLYDIGGHRFYSKMAEVNQLWHQMLGAKFLPVSRLSRIHYQGKFFYYPLRLWNVVRVLGLFEGAWMFASFVHSRLTPQLPEDNFEAYVANRFGRRLYYLFFKTYTEKVWGIPCTEIRAEWAAQRIRGLSFGSVLKGALLRNGHNQIKSLIETFEYPTEGPGMMWNTFKDWLGARGTRTLLQAPVVQVNRTGARIDSVTVRHQGLDQDIRGTHFISTMALRDFIHSLAPPAPDDVLQAAAALKYRDFITVVLILDTSDLFPDNWIYIHTPDVHVGRIQNYRNWSKAMLPDPTKTSLGLEYFVSEGDELWLMPDEKLIELAKTELATLGIAQKSRVVDGTVTRVLKAYPIYDPDYRFNLGIVRGYLDTFENLQTVGRNGMHKYNNQDHSMMTGLLAARNILGENHDVWGVNTDLDYQEEIQLSARAETTTEVPSL